MGDGGDFDLCECINGHDSAMRRLLGMLRQSQAYCSDSSCVDDLSPVPRNSTDPISSSFLIFLATIFAIIGIMFFARPGRSTEGKPRRSYRDQGPEPPAIS
ncbi:Small integral membrane protein 14 [Paragonimus heterotremus]|uniref:Small integral membrane protein 14 n=1 Tax=Paragonimus heterotremus TaxID=100268 RepID=A0A8J4TLI9_9TREM|nr:Small integral membrane protein 14 [Paragonimus heterotremus]